MGLGRSSGSRKDCEKGGFASICLVKYVKEPFLCMVRPHGSMSYRRGKQLRSGCDSNPRPLSTELLGRHMSKWLLHFSLASIEIPYPMKSHTQGLFSPTWIIWSSANRLGKSYSQAGNRIQDCPLTWRMLYQLSYWSDLSQWTLQTCMCRHLHVHISSTVT